VGRKRCRKNRRKGRDRTIHQSRQAGLHDLQDEQSAMGFLFLGLNFRGQVFLFETVG
jgi:hypothetical protein